MPSYKKKIDFFETPEGEKFIEMLHVMAADRSYNTKSSYSANGELYPNHKISFVKKHMAYIKSHPSTNPEHYLANLRLMTRVR